MVSNTEGLMSVQMCNSINQQHTSQVECKKAQPKEVMFPPGTRGRARGLPYTMEAFMLGMGMLSKCEQQSTDAVLT